MSERQPETQPRQHLIPERPTKAPRPTAERKAKRPRGLKGKAMLVAALALAGAVGADYVGLVNLPGMPDVSANPGQQPGKTELSDIDIMKLRVSGTDAIGEARIEVKQIRQEIIDKKEPGEKDNPHETMYLKNGEYTGQWIVAGTWEPKKQKGGDVVITLPKVQGKDVVSLEDGDPVIDSSKSSRALIQYMGGIFGDDSDDAVPRRNAKRALNKMIRDPKKTGIYHTAVACGAIGSAAEKANSLAAVGGFNVERFTPARAKPYKVNKKLPTVSFEIPDPVNVGETLDMTKCLPTLDGIGFDPKTLSSDNNSVMGLATHRILRLKVDPIEQ